MNQAKLMDAYRQTDCPKRIWILSTLSDDEALGSDGTPPRAVQLHLSRCPACRRAAEELLAVSAALRSLGGTEPAEPLVIKANARLAIALAAGATPSNRVMVPDDELLLLESATIGRNGTRRLIPYLGAAAAAIALVIGWLGLVTQESRVERIIVERPHAAARPFQGPIQVPSQDVSQPGPDADGALAGAQLDDKGEEYCTGPASIEGSETDGANCIQRAFALPAKGQRNAVWWSGTRRLDNRSPGVSTMALPKENR